MSKNFKQEILELNAKVTKLQNNNKRDQSSLKDYRDEIASWFILGFLTIVEPFRSGVNWVFAWIYSCFRHREEPETTSNGSLRPSPTHELIQSKLNEVVRDQPRRKPSGVY